MKLNKSLTQNPFQLQVHNKYGIFYVTPLCNVK